MYSAPGLPRLNSWASIVTIIGTAGSVLAALTLFPIGQLWWGAVAVFFFVLAETGPARAEFESLFGDPDLDYQAAIDRHYSQGAPEGWEDNYVSSYATMHPAEDWAETFAHYLHIRDTLDTAAAFGFAPAGATLDHPMAGEAGFDRMIELWLPLAWSLNMINRSMGHTDLYPFVLAAPVVEKLAFVHDLWRAVTAAPAT